MIKLNFQVFNPHQTSIKIINCHSLSTQFLKFFDVSAPVTQCLGQNICHAE